MDKDLFKTIDSIIRKERLYAQVNLMREDIMQRFSIGRHHLNDQLNAFADGMSFPQYINSIRMEVAYDLLTNHPEMTITDVDSLSAGFELLRTYCGNQVHYLFTGISSPEGTFTTALNLDDPQTVLIPDSAFYEFKPKEAKDYYQLLTLDQLEIGRSYELIVSTLSGLYRYKTQKTLLVVGRYHDTPTVIVDKR